VFKKQKKEVWLKTFIYMQVNYYNLIYIGIVLELDMYHPFTAFTARSDYNALKSFV